ncbi:protein GUCD1 isoform X2 [Wyeomyia smithii]|uniref:protein GUCD1 isoform X2 n=1 Tax=Wyeomyia smithii TaxID=174621 RepID=UPI002467CE6E|nr:protein GUCD1 isoform X2 [Wyeomyia smithii]
MIETCPAFIEHSLVHFRQRFEWDCANFEEICKAAAFKESTWTIDLCYILKDLGIKHKYLTTTFGANPTHIGKKYYKCFDKDQTRVNQKFQNAESDGIPIEIRSVDYEYLIMHLANHGNIILLTNASLLYCDLCKANKLTMDLRSCFGLKSAYMGHYIILCGYDQRIRKFIYRNPAFKNKVCFMSFEAIESARKASGTDEDIVLIYDKKTVI